MSAPRALLPRERELLRGHEPSLDPGQPPWPREVGPAMVVGETWPRVHARQLAVSGLLLQRTALEHIEDEDGRWSDCTVRGGSWHRGRFERTRFEGCTFDGTRLEGCTFERCTFERCTFENSRLQACTFVDCQLVGCTLVAVRADLVLEGCVLEDCEAAGTSVSGRCDRLEWMGGRASLLSLTELQSTSLVLRDVRLEQLELLGGRHGELVLRRCSGHDVSLCELEVETLLVAGCDSLVMLRLLGGHVGALRLEGSTLANPVLAGVALDRLWASRSSLHDAHLQGVHVGGGSVADGRIVGAVIEGGRFSGLGLPRTTLEGYLSVRGGEFQGLDLQLTPPPPSDLEVELDGPTYVGPGDRWEVWSGA